MSARLGETDLERALVRVASSVAFPSGENVAPAVIRRLESEQVARVPALDRLRLRLRGGVAGRSLRPAWQGVAAAAAAVILIFGAVVGLSPTARRAVADFLGLRGVKIVVEPSPTATLGAPPLGAGLNLGQRMSLSEAQDQVPFQIVLPQDPRLGQPDEVYLTTLPTGGPEVFLVYRERSGIPRAVPTGTGLLISVFQARVDEEILLKKVLEPGTSVEAVRVDGSTGYWIFGRPHYVLVLDSHGNIVQDAVRLAGNVLLWERGDVTVRLEAAITKDEAVRIAESVDRSRGGLR